MTDGRRCCARLGFLAALALARPAPAQQPPAQPEPAQPEPAQPVPAQPVPAQPEPAQPVPAQIAHPEPAQPEPAQALSTQALPAQPPPAQQPPAQIAQQPPVQTPLVRPHLAIRVAIDVEGRVATGRMVADVPNTGRLPLTHLELWRYPARLERRSPALSEHDFHRVHPNRFDAGTMAITDVTAGGVAVTPLLRDSEPAGAGTLVVVPLPAPLPPGAVARVALTFATRIPERYGAFGCYARTCTLSGGFHPMPLQLGADGFDRHAPPARADIELVVDSAADDVVIDGRPARWASLTDVAWAVVVAGRPFRRESIVHRGVEVTWLHRRGQPVRPLGGRREVEHPALADVREAIDLLHELDMAPSEGTEVRLVEAPLRLELASAQGRSVLVSDQLFRLFPYTRFRKFHSFQLAGAVFESLLEERLRARERPADLALSPAVGAAWLIDLFTVHRHRGSEFAADILKWVSFIPTVDRILYAPQIPFATAYFKSMDDPDPTRDDLRRFANGWPRGKLIHEKLRDLLGDAGTTALLRALWAGTPLREAAAAQGVEVDAFFRQWLGPRPQVDYRLRIVGRERTADGFRYQVRLEKHGPVAGVPIEPVEIEVVEWGGARQRLRWDGHGREHELVVHTRRSMRSIALDPRGRLTQVIDGDNDDHRLDDRRPAPVKALWNDFGATVNLQTPRLDASADFSLSRIYDVKNVARLVLFTNEATTVGTVLGYTRAFGRKVLPSRLTSNATVALRVARLDPGFAAAFTGVPIASTRISLGLGLGYDDRRYLFEPWRYTSLEAGVSYSLTVLDNGQTFQQLTASAGLTRSFLIAPGHSVALSLAAAATFGDLRLPSQLLFAGGPNGVVRGYEADELPGRSLLAARVEYRHMFVRNLDWNVLWLYYIRGIGGAFYTEAALVSPCDGHVLSRRGPAHDIGHNLYGDVGYSLRFFGDFFGVAQNIFNIDVAVPLVRRDRTCTMGPEDPAEPVLARQRGPVGFFFAFGPVF